MHVSPGSDRFQQWQIGAKGERFASGHGALLCVEGPGPGMPGDGRGATKKPLGKRGLMPLVARLEPYRPRYRAGFATLLAISRLAGASSGQNPRRRS